MENEFFSAAVQCPLHPAGATRQDAPRLGPDDRYSATPLDQRRRRFTSPVDGPLAGTSCVGAPISSPEGTETRIIQMQFGTGSYTSSKVRVCLQAALAGPGQHPKEFFCETFNYSKNWRR